MYGSTGDAAQAIAAWQKVPQSEIQAYAVAQYNIGSVYEGQEKDEAALAAYGNIPEADTMHYAMGQFNSAVLLHMHGNFRAALGSTRTCLRACPTSTPARS